MAYDHVCPWCGSKRIYCEEVDIGVGFQQVTPYECADCTARQFYSAEDAQDATPEERRHGWHAPLHLHPDFIESR